MNFITVPIFVLLYLWGSAYFVHAALDPGWPREWYGIPMFITLFAGFFFSFVIAFVVGDWAERKWL